MMMPSCFSRICLRLPVKQATTLVHLPAGFLTGSQTVASASPAPPASSGPNTGAIAGGVVGAIAAAVIAGLSQMHMLHICCQRQFRPEQHLMSGDVQRSVR